MEAAPPAPSARKSVLLWGGFVVFTLAFAFATAWPFLTAWQLRYSPAYLASRDFVLASEEVGAIVGPNRYAENDTFPRGGAESETDGAKARFEHKLVGDTQKAKVSTILYRAKGEWMVERAAVEKDGEWVEIYGD